MTALAASHALCRHCGAPLAGGRMDDFCCTGCAAAAQLTDRAQPLSSGCVNENLSLDYTRYAERVADGGWLMLLMVEGMRCAACAFQIERTLNAEDQVRARMNLTTRRLTLHWAGSVERVNSLISKVQAAGYRLLPFDAATLETTERQEARHLLRCLAVAGFAAGNIMILADALWAAAPGDMGLATRDLLHWLSALIALPTVVYAGQPFFRSAWQALRHRRTNMDVPIAVALLLTSAMSVYEMLRHGDFVYFDCVVMLIFLLLTGRYLDKQARGRARAAAQHLLAFTGGTAVVLEGGRSRLLPVAELQTGMELQIAAGERIAVDGVVTQGVSELDPSFMTGETITQPVKPGDPVFSGMVNGGAPLHVRVTAVGSQSLLGNVIHLMEQAEQGQARYVRLADRVAALYTPAVHLLALLAFLLWWGWLQAGWQPALLTAMTVLIITCPCALGLAVPVVQVLASTALFKRGLLLKAPDALERLAAVDTIIFDKTGTLTRGRPEWLADTGITTEQNSLALVLAAASRHPLARALMRGLAESEPAVVTAVTEHPGQGMSASWQGVPVRLGRRDWCGVSAAVIDDKPELWLQVGNAQPVRYVFADAPRDDAAAVCALLQRQGYALQLLSGDRPVVAGQIAAQLGIADWHAAQTPPEKVAVIRALQAQGRKVLMVGDGLNDAPALAAADCSISPSSALDIAQNAADLVFQGEKLAPVAQALRVARRAQQLVTQNFLLAFLYNLVAVPLAMAGQVTPLVAAIAMAASSLIVVLNAQRLHWGIDRP